MPPSMNSPIPVTQHQASIRSRIPPEDMERTMSLANLHFPGLS
jgi:hypothetical protein